VAVSDSSGGVCCEEGLEINKLIKIKDEVGRVQAARDNGVKCEAITNENLLEMDVDVLVPAAMENAVTADNADHIQAPVIVELANGPITPEADVVLNRKGVFLLPDILANAGGVTVSYFEWVQNKTGFYWTLEDVHRRLRERMVVEFNHIYDISKEKQIDMRTAAYVHALTRLGVAIESLGTRRFFSVDSD
jgi:glutamate dehydrogenase (NADP+)